MAYLYYTTLDIMHQIGRYLISSVGLLSAGLRQFTGRIFMGSRITSLDQGGHDGAADQIPVESPSISEQQKLVKVRPTHFVAIQISDPKIHHKVKEVQDAIIDAYPRYEETMIPLKKLHITLMVLALNEEEELLRARDVVENLADDFRELCPRLLLTFRGLGDFGHRVVFVKMEDGDEKRKLTQFAALVRSRFCEAGLPHTDSKDDFTPHLTLMKLSRGKQKIRKIDPEIYSDYVQTYFGCHVVSSLQICLMSSDKTTSYYRLLHEEWL